MFSLRLASGIATTSNNLVIQVTTNVQSGIEPETTESVLPSYHFEIHGDI